MFGQRSEYGTSARVAGSARAYTPTRVTDKELLAPNTSYAMMHSMSAMVENANLSVEEIRARERRATVNQPAPTFSFGARPPSTAGGSSASSFTFGARPSSPTSPFGAPSSPFGAPSSPFSAPSSPFSAPSSAFGAPPSPPPGGSGAQLSTFGAQTSTTSNPFGVQSAPTTGGFDTRATSSSSAANVFGAPSSMGCFVASQTPGSSQGRGRGNGGGRRERHSERVRSPPARTPRQGEAFAYPPRVATDAKFGTAATSSAPFAPQAGFGASTPAATPAFGGFSTGAAFGTTQSAAQSASGASPSTRGTLFGTSEGTFHTSPSAPSAGAGLFNVAPTAASGAFGAPSAAGSASFGASTPVTGCGLFGASTPAGGGLCRTCAPNTGGGSLFAAQPIRLYTPDFVSPTMRDADASQATSGASVVDDDGVAMEIKTTVQEPAVVVVVLVVQDTKPSDTVISDVAAPTMEPIQTRTLTSERQPDVEQATETASEAADASVSPRLPPQPAVDNGTTRPVVDVSDAQVAALEDYLQTGFGLVHDDGVDSEGMPVVTVNATRIPGWAGSGDRARSMQLLTKALTHVAEKGEYSVVVYFGCDDRAKGVVPSGAVQWLRDIHDSLPRTSKKNVKKVVFVNVPTLVSALISVTMPFVSAKAAKKFVWAKSLEDMDKATNYHLSVNHCGERFKRSIQYVGADAQATEPTPA